MYILHQILKTKVSNIQGPGVHTCIFLYLVEEEAPSSSWTVCSSLKATRLSVPDLEGPPFLVAGVGGGCSRWEGWGWCCFFDACEDEEEAGESPWKMTKIDLTNLSMPIMLALEHFCIINAKINIALIYTVLLITILSYDKPSYRTYMYRIKSCTIKWMHLFFWLNWH